MYICQSQSPNSSPPFPPSVSICFFCISMSPFLFHTYNPDGFQSVMVDALLLLSKSLTYFFFPDNCNKKIIREGKNGKRSSNLHKLRQNKATTMQLVPFLVSIREGRFAPCVLVLVLSLPLELCDFGQETYF